MQTPQMAGSLHARGHFSGTDVEHRNDGHGWVVGLRHPRVILVHVHAEGSPLLPGSWTGLSFHHSFGKANAQESTIRSRFGRKQPAHLAADVAGAFIVELCEFLLMGPCSVCSINV